MIIKNETLFNNLLRDSEQTFKGWDFSYLNQSSRMVEFPLSWNYTIEVLRELTESKSLLDMGTGGGEFLSTLPLPKYTCATEGYPPNVQIAKDRLEPLGVHVYQIEDDNRLPFDDHSFDFIINRHEAFSSKELKRILLPNGYFITQQVGGKNDQELNSLLESEESIYASWNLDEAINKLQDEHFTILKQKEDITKTRFYDIGAIIYYLKAIPWQIPDFSIAKYRNHLIKIHNMIKETGYLDITCHRFFIIAKK
ncbi:methyltransferase domain-containing protein [Mycoplasmatota bacterium]|nr:methyltransferase domain-containing protein [Mycoplasmatota bacterium]